MKNSILFKETNLVIEELNISPADYEQTVCYDSFAEICVVVSGNGIYRVLGKEIPCKEGDLFVINSGISHGYSAQENGLTLRKITLNLGCLLKDDKEAYDNSCYGVFSENPIMAYAMLNAEAKAEFDNRLEAVKNELGEKRDGWECAVRFHISLLLISLGRYINEAIKSERPFMTKEWGMVSAAINFIMENYGDGTFTLESVAAALFVSSSKLSRYFRELTGNSFSEYIRKIRLDKACELLKDTEMPIEEIVTHCGLKDIPSFYRVFNTYTGVTPGTYRTNEKNKKLYNTKGEKIMIILSEISTQLQTGKAKLVKEMVQQAIDEGVSPEIILKEGLLPGMNVVGEKFKNNEIFVPEVLIAARAMKQGADLLKPLLIQEGVPAAGKVCIGTVHGDLHDIGKNIVKMMLEGKGFEVVDLGTDVPAETFVKTAIDEKCDIICCSALLTTTMGVMEDVVKAAEAAGIRGKVKIMVGGAPISQEFCDKIGADAYTTDAASCAELALELCK